MQKRYLRICGNIKDNFSYFLVGLGIGNNVQNRFDSDFFPDSFRPPYSIKFLSFYGLHISLEGFYINLRQFTYSNVFVKLWDC